VGLYVSWLATFDEVRQDQDPTPGVTYYLPPTVLGRSVTARVLSVQDGKAQLQLEDASPGHGVWIPLSSLPQFLDDMRGRIRIPTGAPHPALEALGQGRYRFLAKGDDGICFLVTPETGRPLATVVKASTTSPRRPFLDNHRTPEEAVRMLQEQYQLARRLVSLGFPVVPSQGFEYASRFFVLSPLLDTPAILGASQLASISRAYDLLARHGWALRDRPQVGIDPATGHVYFYDVGKATSAATPGDLENDRKELRRLYESNGVPVPAPTGLHARVAAFLNPLHYPAGDRGGQFAPRDAGTNPGGDPHDVSRGYAPPGTEEDYKLSYAPAVVPGSSANASNPELPHQARPLLDLAGREALRMYSGGPARALNAALRRGNYPTGGDLAPMYEGLQGIFAKLEPLDPPPTVRRGINLRGAALASFIQRMQEAQQTGIPLVMGGLISTTTLQDLPPAFFGSVRLEIKAHQGIDVKPFSLRQNEDELLLNHNSQFRVLKVERATDNPAGDDQTQWILHLEQTMAPAPEKPLARGLVARTRNWLKSVFFRAPSPTINRAKFVDDEDDHLHSFKNWHEYREWCERQGLAPILPK
jgi:hypothetical protein